MWALIELIIVPVVVERLEVLVRECRAVRGPLVVGGLVPAGVVRIIGRGVRRLEQCRGLLQGAAHWPERLALGALYLGRVGATAALEVEMLSDRVVKQAHPVKPTRHRGDWQ
jgi:hypothetical protein